MFKISQSKINTARKCLKAYQYKYHDKLRRRAKARPLQFGGIVHSMIEADIEGRDPFEMLDAIEQDNKRLFREEREMYGEIVEDARYIFQGYKQYWKDDPLIYLAHDGRKSEHEFEIDLTSDIRVTGKVDAAAKSKRMNWLVEHKTHKNFPNSDHRWRNLQSAVYMRLVEMLGWWSFEGTLWDYIRSKPPTRPQLLKSGELSSRDVDTLPQVVLDTLQAHNLSKRNYAELIDKVKANQSNWYQRVYTPIKKTVVDNLLRDFTTSARWLRDVDFDKQVPRTIGRHCGWCEYEPLCRAFLQGSDEEYVMEKEYVAKDDEVEEAVEREDA